MEMYTSLDTLIQDILVIEEIGDRKSTIGYHSFVGGNPCDLNE